MTTMRRQFILVSVCSLLLFSCIPSSPPSLDEEASPGTPNDSLIDDNLPIRETNNVVYQGTVKPAGISIYQQGSHRLMLPDGRFILLESDSVDLNGYVNEEVEVTGALRPTVEAGGMIMRVEKARLIVEEELPEEGDDTTGDDDTSPEEDSVDNSDDKEGPKDKEPLASESEEEKQEEEEGSDVTSPKPQEPEEPIVSTPPELNARTEKMASESFTPDQWTQQYCTAHIGFCIPIHRNWWFKSFGTTTSFLWHVELSSEEVVSLFDGPIHVNLVAGTVSEKNASDGQLKQERNKSVGYREWDNHRHFEISAPIALEEAVRYITQNLSEYGAE